MSSWTSYPITPHYNPSYPVTLYSPCRYVGGVEHTALNIGVQDVVLTESEQIEVVSGDVYGSHYGWSTPGVVIGYDDIGLCSDLGNAAYRLVDDITLYSLHLGSLFYACSFFITSMAANQNHVYPLFFKITFIFFCINQTNQLSYLHKLL